MADYNLPPGPLSAYLGVRDANSRAGLVDTQNSIGQMGILSQIQKQQQEKAYRGAIASATTPEEQLAVASKYMGPDALGKMIQSSQDRKVTSDQTKQIALMRLSQQAQRDLSDIQHKARTATSKEERDHWQQQIETTRLGFQKQAGEIAAGRYTYETGNAVEPFRGVIPQPAGTPLAPQPMTPTEGTGAAGIQPASAGGSMSGSPNILSLANRVSDPAERAGVLSQLLAQQQGAGAAPSAAPPGGLSALLPPPQPTSSFPSGPTGNQDMRDVRSTLPAGANSPVIAAPVQTSTVVAPPAMATAPVAQALPPMPPEIASAPMAVQNKWKLQNTRPAPVGGILSNENILNRQLTTTIRPHREVLDAYQRFNEIKATGDNSQANIFLAEQLKAMAARGTRALPKAELERILGSGDLGNDFMGRAANLITQWGAGVRTPSIDKKLSDLADAMAKASADRIGQEMQNARASAPSGANPDNITGSKPRIYGRFIITPTGRVHTFQSSAEAQAKLQEASQKVGE